MCGGKYLLSAFAGAIDARCDTRDVLGELLRALGIYVHFFGHDGCSVQELSRVTSRA